MKFRISFLIIGACLLMVACHKPTRENKDIFSDLVDTSAAPGTDFFLYSMGKWIKNNPIPAEESSWGIGNLVMEENQRRLKNINEMAAKTQATPGSTEQKIGDFWTCAMDSDRIEKEGLKPLEATLNMIDAAQTPEELAFMAGSLDRMGINSIIGWYVDQDEMNSAAVRFKLYQGGLYLGEREYYFKTDTAGLNILKSYRQYIQEMLQLLGVNATEAQQQSDAILNLETRLAQAHKKLEDTRDPYQNYHATSLTELKKAYPDFNWESFLTGIKAPALDTLIIAQKGYYEALNQEWKTQSLSLWKNLLKFRLADGFSGALPARFGDAKFNFTRLITGAQAQQVRWKRVIRAEEGIMGELLGQLFVKEYFNETAKKRYENLVTAIKDAYRERISRLDWMSDSTKQRAYTKLATMKQKVGYPDKWKDFSSLEINKDGYIPNLISGNTWWNDYSLAKIGKPVNRDEWNMFPQTYNAYYNPSNNEIVLPAGIFTVPGFRDEELDDAVVYGYAGASTIGHEITHGFDDQGRLFDEHGNLADWWTATDNTRFNEKAKTIVNQFNAYEVIDGLHINGSATQGENIADLGGIVIGLDAFRKTEQYQSGKALGGFSPLQRYFLGYALGWLYQSRPEALRNQVMTDVHSPASYRVNGPFVNVDAFYEAFNIQPGAPMYVASEQRVRIW